VFVIWVHSNESKKVPLGDLAIDLAINVNLSNKIESSNEIESILVVNQQKNLTTLIFC